MRPSRAALATLLMAASAGGCAQPGPSVSPAPVPVVAHVDLPRFMGRWYVIANIPTWLERDAYDATETYTLAPDGRIRTEFRYRKGGFETRQRSMHPVGTVRAGTGNARWGMQFLWPFKAEYLIAWLAPDYSQVVVARSDRDYAWVMARTPTIPDADLQAHRARLQAWGYDVGKLRLVPQRATPPAR